MIGSLFIVEDEPMFRQGIRKLIETNETGWTVQGEASNGKEALERMGTELPDLILTDIRMPGMDGLGLMKEIRERDKEVLIIIITGHKDFEYAQAAVRYGVMDFLIKPCSEEEMAKVLIKARETLMERRAKREQKVVERKISDLNIIRSLLLKIPYDTSAMERLEREYKGFQLWGGYVESYFPAGKEYREEDVGLLQFAIVNIMEECLQNEGLTGMVIPVSYNRIALLISFSKSTGAVLDNAIEQIELHLGIELNAFPCGILDKLLDTQELFCVWAKGSGSSEGGRTVPEADTGHVVFTSYGHKLKDQLSAQLIQGQPGILKEYLLGQMELARSLPLAKLKMSALGILNVLHEVRTKELGLAPAPNASSPFEKVQEKRSGEALIELIHAEIEAFHEEVKAWLSDRHQSVINRALRYVEEHYMEECTLTDAAQHVHLNSSYFSNFFKKETGESFVNYVTKIRMEKAGELLARSNLKIFEIAMLIGYNDPNYFTTVFKQYFTCSPSEYRKRHAGSI